MTVKEFSEKYHISQQAVYAKIKRKSAQLDGKNAECENLKKSLSDEITKNEKLQNCLNDKNSEIEKLQSQLAEQELKKSDFDNLADMLKNEILKISYKIDDVQNSISEITKKNSNSIIGLLKK